MKDIQSQHDHRKISIKKVGVKNISYPITVLDKERKVQRTVATFNMYVNLPHHFKGTHMSRFIEILNRFHGDINLRSLQAILKEMKTRLQAEESHIEIDFPFFLKKTATSPYSAGIAEYRCRMHGCLAEEDSLTLTITVPIAPPSPEQPEKGLPRSSGHWGMAEVAVNLKHFIWLEDLVSLVEEVTSHHLLHPNLSPEDLAAQLSVESITKALGEKLRHHPALRSFSIMVENFAAGFSTFAATDWQAEAPPAAA